MTAETKIQFGGLGLVSTTLKTLDRNTRYDRLFKKPDWSQRIVRRAGLVVDVVADMKDVIFKYRSQTKEFAPYMRGISIYETCRNIWNFWYSRCKYKEDIKGLEQLRTSDRSYWEGAGFAPDADKEDFGIDCDDFSIAVSQTLLNLSIPCYLRIARYAGVDHFQHVYVIVPYGKSYITIDCVLDRFDSEKPPVETKDFLIMDRHNLNGIDVAVLSGIGSSGSPLLDVVTGSDFFALSGTENPSDKELAALHEHITKTRNLIAENPELVKEAEHPETFLKMLDYALKYWHTDKRDEALAILAARENETNELRGFSPGSDTSESEIEMKALSGGGYEVLGKVGGQRKFFGKIKEAVKDAGKGIKKVAQTAVRYNPLTVAARAGLLLAFKTNFLHMGDHLKWGYLPDKDAKEIGFDMDEHAKAKDSLSKTDKLFTNVLQGQPDNLRHAILSGRAGGLAGINLGELGIEPVTTTTTTAAATGFIAQIKAWIKNIDLKKMLKNVDPKKLADKAKNALNKTQGRGNSGSEEKNSSSEDKGENKETERKPDEESGLSAALPLLVIGGLGLMMLSGSDKPKKQLAGFHGFGSTKKKKKAKTKKQVKATDFNIPPLAGVLYSGANSKNKNSKKKGTAKSKIKKLKLR